MNRTKILGLVLGALAFTLILLFFKPQELSKEGVAVLASAVLIAIWWITEALPIAVTALLPIVIFPLTGGLSLPETTSAYGHKYIFLYMGGFIIAIAIEKWNLHKRIALNIIHFIGTNVTKIILGFMIATAFLSMWISNTATSVMMLPIGIAIINQLKDNPNTAEDENKIFGKALMLSIAYSASIGGIATLIGTPPNLVLAGVILETYDYEVTFFEWLKFALPISLILLFITWKYLTKYAFTFKQKEFPGGKEEVKKLVKELGAITYEEKIVSVIFICTALCWILRSYVLQNWFPKIDDTIIAIFFSIILFMLPSKDRKDKILNWEEAVKMPWGIIILFGGGMCLAKAFSATGLAVWLGTQMASFSVFPLLVLLLLVVASVNFLTEITSNLATTAMLLPILAPMALEIDVHPYVLMIGATVAASCAFMLPVATPPNAVVFGSGYLKISDMVKKGLVLNMISIMLITLFVYVVLPLVWNISIDEFPSMFKK